MNKIKEIKSETIVGEISETETETIFTELKESGPKKKKINRSIIEKRWKFFVIIAMFTSPLVVAFISMLHIKDLFFIGNFAKVAWALAIAYELLLISAFISLRQLRILDSFSKISLWAAIIVLAAIQVFGNVFSVYVKIDEKMAMKFAELIGREYNISVKRLIAIIIGSPLPITSLIFTKIGASFWYLSGKKKNEKK